MQGSDRQVEIDGIQALVGGDVITAIDGRPVNSMDDLITSLGRYDELAGLNPDDAASQAILLKDACTQNGYQ